jgi:excisionase family DNA binding protein
MANWTLHMTSAHRQAGINSADGVISSHSDRLLTIHEVSALTRLAVGTLYHFVSDGRIPVIHLSRRCIRFRLSDLEHWIDSMAKLPVDNEDSR